MKDALLEGRNLTKEFRTGRGRTVHAVTDVSLSLPEGETLGLVGESGCGKSTLGRLLIRALRPTAGEVLFQGRPLNGMGEREFRPLRRQMQMVFQDPYASLDPRMTVRDLVAEPLETYGVFSSREETTKRVGELLEAVGVGGESLYRYPHQFSGGQRQRIGIARAVAADPAVLVLDEPVSALDVSVQNQILDLLSDLKRQRGLTCLFISHDLSVVRHISDRVCVMFLGKVCETGPTEEVYRAPLHPYTSFLIRAVPGLDPRKRSDGSDVLRGEMPSPLSPPSGCRFRTRCPFAAEKCAATEPPLIPVGERQVACHYPLNDPRTP